jgi:hypothetical protein
MPSGGDATGEELPFSTLLQKKEGDGSDFELFSQGPPLCPKTKLRHQLMLKPRSYFIRRDEPSTAIAYTAGKHNLYSTALPTVPA